MYMFVCLIVYSLCLHYWLLFPQSAPPPPPAQSGVMYAALNLAPPNVPPPVEDSTYKQIDHKATAKLEREKRGKFM